jgi:hypothetical protein
MPFWKKKDPTGTRIHPAITTLTYVLVALPIISLVLNAISWIKYGVDVPFWDDWRQYGSGDMGRIDLRYLLTPANDTLYSFGLLLDSLAIRFLDGNTVAYQFISLVGTLGALLVSQWRLISLSVDNYLIRACAFSLTVLMVQPDSYWGLQNMAFHQAIPLICVLISLNIVLCDFWKAKWAVPSLAILSVVSGFSYTSGAFAMLGLSVSILIAQYIISEPFKKRFLVSGLSLLGPALVSTSAQIWVIVVVQHGTHRTDAPMAFPWEFDFWLFLLGKIARSLMLPISTPSLSFGICLAVVALTLVFFLRAVSKLNSHELSMRESSLMIIFSSLIVVISIYLLLVSAGRTNLRPEHVQSKLDIFKYGFHRFHFFWVTLLWPWLAAVILHFFFKLNANRTAVGLVPILFLTAIILGAKYSDLFNHGSYYQRTQVRRLEGLNCIQQAIERQSKIFCPQLLPFDLTRAVANAQDIEASFTRYFFYRPIPLGTNEPEPLYRLSENINEVVVVNAKRVSESEKELVISVAKNDPNLHIVTGNATSMRNCRKLQVTALLDAEVPDVAQLFFIPTGKQKFREGDSRIAHIEGKKNQQISLLLNSATGFEDQLRFDPVTKSQTLSIKELEVRCRLPISATRP